MDRIEEALKLEDAIATRNAQRELQHELKRSISSLKNLSLRSPIMVSQYTVGQFKDIQNIIDDLTQQGLISEVNLAEILELKVDEFVEMLEVALNRLGGYNVITEGGGEGERMQKLYRKQVAAALAKEEELSDINVKLLSTDQQRDHYQASRDFLKRVNQADGMPSLVECLHLMIQLGNEKLDALGVRTSNLKLVVMAEPDDQGIKNFKIGLIEAANNPRNSIVPNGIESNQAYYDRVDKDLTSNGLRLLNIDEYKAFFEIVKNVEGNDGIDCWVASILNISEQDKEKGIPTVYGVEGEVVLNFIDVDERAGNFTYRPSVWVNYKPARK